MEQIGHWAFLEGRESDDHFIQSDGWAKAAQKKNQIKNLELRLFHKHGAAQNDALLKQNDLNCEVQIIKAKPKDCGYFHSLFPEEHPLQNSHTGNFSVALCCPLQALAFSFSNFPAV